MQIVARTRLTGAITRAPLAGNYAAAVVLALLALCPFIVLTTASSLFQASVMHDLGVGRFALQLTAGLSNAAYAFGAVVAADLVQRIPARRVYLACEALFVAGSLLAALAPSIGVFTSGRVLQGLATGMLLVAALPPLVTNHGADRLPATAAVVNLGLFGMVTLGPLVGGLAASTDAWRLLLAAIAGLGAVGFTMGVVGFERTEPPDPDMTFDRYAMPLALAGTVLPFLGVSWLTRGSFDSLGFLVPLIVGVIALVVLIVGQYHKRDALMPVRPITHTLPIAGTASAMVVGATFTTFLSLAEVYLLEVGHHSPVGVGALVTSQIGGVVLATWLFKRVLPTKWTPILALGGLVSVAAGGGVLLGVSPGTAAIIVPVAALLLGFGAGAGVAPGLFMAGLSVPSAKIGRTFALVELLRSEAAFLIGPVLLSIAMSSAKLAGGLHLAILITLVFTAVSGVAVVGLYLLGGARPHPPDLERWLGGDSTAYHSPRVAALVRGD